MEELFLRLSSASCPNDSFQFKYCSWLCTQESKPLTFPAFYFRGARPSPLFSVDVTIFHIGSFFLCMLMACKVRDRDNLCNTGLWYFIANDFAELWLSQGFFFVLFCFLFFLGEGLVCLSSSPEKEKDHNHSSCHINGKTSLMWTRLHSSSRLWPVFKERLRK